VTCIAAKLYRNRRVVFAGDSLIIEGDTSIPGPPKVSLVAHWGPVGFAGDLADVQSCMHLWESHADPARLATAIRAASTGEELSGWLAYHDGRLLEIWTNGAVIPVDSLWWAIGSGANAARTALLLGHSPYTAVRAACELRTDCGGRITQIEWRAAESP
jgi:ATP-dependent protease HslVU (ClpYQ) peptidase subunit